MAGYNTIAIAILCRILGIMYNARMTSRKSAIHYDTVRCLYMYILDIVAFRCVRLYVRFSQQCHKHGLLSEY